MGGAKACKPKTVTKIAAVLPSKRHRQIGACRKADVERHRLRAAPTALSASCGALVICEHGVSVKCAAEVERAAGAEMTVEHSREMSWDHPARTDACSEASR